MPTTDSTDSENLDAIAELQSKIEQLRRAVRSGDFDQHGLVNEIWAQRTFSGVSNFHRLSIHTLIWEVFDSRGGYTKAATYLRDGGVVERAVELLLARSLKPNEFVAQEFPDSLQGDERERRYNHWRQHAMAALAHCFCAFRLHEHGYEPRLELVRMFLDQCLGPAGFLCNGTRSRLHFFLAQIYEAGHDICRAAAEYSTSLHYCLQRAEARLRPDVSPEQQKTERAFAIYCLGKLKLRLGQIESDQGRLAIAGDHAREAGLLLRISKDRYLPEMAKLLACHIRRHEDTLHQHGPALLSEIRKVRANVADHPPFHLEARLEEAIVSIYLVPRTKDNERQFREALNELSSIVRDARRLGLSALEFGALLAVVRTHLHLGEWPEAHTALNQARIFAAASPSRKADAEVKYVEGKLHTAEGKRFEKQMMKEGKESFRLALECFRQAMRLKHPRVTFQVACAEHVGELLLKRGRIVEAKKCLTEASRQLQGIESTFLRKRLDNLLAQVKRAQYAVFEFQPPFDLNAAMHELERRFLDSLALYVGKDLQEIKHNWKQYAARLEPLQYYQLKQLISKRQQKAEGKPRKTAGRKPPAT